MKQKEKELLVEGVLISLLIYQEVFSDEGTVFQYSDDVHKLTVAYLEKYGIGCTYEDTSFEDHLLTFVYEYIRSGGEGLSLSVLQRQEIKFMRDFQARFNNI